MKKIAIIICGMRYANQQEFIQGAAKCIEENGGNIFVFVCNTVYSQAELYKRGAFEMYQFMNPEEYDGIILLRNTIHYEPAQEYIIKKLQESEVPAISVSARTEGMGYIGFDDYEAMYRMTEHVIKKHNIKKIAYVDGTKEYQDARIRAQAFRDALKKEKISFERRWFYEGDFNIESGVAAVEEFERMNSMPEAIICSNDCMAAGAIMGLQEMGYRVPEDVLVTGFDDVSVAKDNSPRITTIQCDRIKMGYLSCECLLTKSSEEIKKLSIVIPTNPIYSESCGCRQEEETDIDELKRRILRQSVLEKRYRNKINEIFAEFVNCDTPEEFVEAARKFVPGLKADYFYMAFGDMEAVIKKLIYQYTKRGKTTEKEGIKGKKEEYELVITYEKGELLPARKIETGKLLPDKNLNRAEGVLYYVMPLHYESQFFGYCVVGNCRLAMGMDILYHYLINMGDCIESMLKRQALQRLTQKLDRMSDYDNLTGLYNRRGFQGRTEEYTRHAKSTGRNLFLSFVDIDGLKKVNDIHGHHSGDNLIQSIANCLQASCRKEEICMRFGGDEFVILGLENVADSRHLEFERDFEERLKEENEKEEQPYLISASIGSYVIENVESTNIQLMLDKADTEMYLRKKASKRKAEK